MIFDYPQIGTVKTEKFGEDVEATIKKLERVIKECEAAGNEK